MNSPYTSVATVKGLVSAVNGAWGGGDSYLHGDGAPGDRRSGTQSQAGGQANPLDTGEELSTQDDSTYREILEQIAERYPSPQREKGKLRREAVRSA